MSIYILYDYIYIYISYIISIPFLGLNPHYESILLRPWGQGHISTQGPDAAEHREFGAGRWAEPV